MGEPDRRPRRIAPFVATLGVGALLGLLDRLGGENAIAERQLEYRFTPKLGAISFASRVEAFPFRFQIARQS
jgi:hypothetical protein